MIANTYMGRLGNAALERYQQLNKQLYSSMDAQGHRAQGPASRSSSDKNSAGAASELRTAFGGQQPSSPSDPSGVAAGGGQGGMTHFGLVGSPNYPDIASDKGSYKSNTPKHIRRRHSDSGDEDLTKALQRADKAQQQHALENVAENGSNNSNNKNNAGSGTANAEAKSQHSNSAGQRLGSDSRDNGPSLPTKPQPEETAEKKVAVVVRRKKTILKGDNRRKSLNRVSFDPLALLLDASLEGELDLVMRTAKEVRILFNIS